MANATLQHLDMDITHLKKELTLIKNILVEEGLLTPWARKELMKARAIPRHRYTKLKEL